MKQTIYKLVKNNIHIFYILFVWWVYSFEGIGDFIFLSSSPDPPPTPLRWVARPQRKYVFFHLRLPSNYIFIIHIGFTRKESIFYLLPIFPLGKKLKITCLFLDQVFVRVTLWICALKPAFCSLKKPGFLKNSLYLNLVRAFSLWEI